MLTLLRAEDSLPEERTSGIYATVPRTSADRALAELRDITGEQPVAALLPLIPVFAIGMPIKELLKQLMETLFV